MWQATLIFHPHKSMFTDLKPGVGNRPVSTYAYLSQVDQIA